MVESGEQCDRGTTNDAPGSPCSAACTWRCESSATCDDGNPCNGAETCTDHACAAGTPLSEDASCGTGMICRSNTCVSTSCGDGVVSGSEECDDGNQASGDGCESSCTFSCVATDATRNCAAVDACAGPGECSAVTHTCTTGTPLPDNTACGTDNNDYCKAGICTVRVCGDGIVDPGEGCDDGNQSDADGCEANCTLPACGNTIVDPGEGCDDGNQTSGDGCEADCTLPTSPACGNTIVDLGESCDDGNQLNLDGCDAQCNFEQNQRLVSLVQQFGTDAFCPKNDLGNAITAEGQDIIQQTWSIPVADGSLSILFKFLDLVDLTGQNSTFKLGFINARAAGRVRVDTPVCGNGICEESALQPGASETATNNPELAGFCPADCRYDGTNDLDWWYIRDAASVDASETPLVQLAGQVSNGHLTAGPGSISLQLVFAFEPAQVALHHARVEAQVDGPVTAPLLSTTGTPPGHLASEHLVSTLESFASSSTGAMCSDVSAQSLFQTPLPQLLAGLCVPATANPDVAAFGPGASLLDLFVAGCNLFGTVPLITPAQPDGALDGSTYTLTTDRATGVTASCTRDGATASLADCVASATFSSYFTFTTDRVIIQRN